MVSDLAQDLYFHFVTYGYQWKIGDEYRTPDPDEIQKALDKMAGTVYDKGSGTVMTMGHLIMVRNDDHTDVYLHIGEYSDKDR